MSNEIDLSVVSSGDDNASVPFSTQKRESRVHFSVVINESDEDLLHTDDENQPLPPLLQIHIDSDDDAEFLFDSIELQFNLNIFVRHFIYHLFPYLFIFSHTTDFRAQGFLIWSYFPVLYNHISTLSYYIMILSYAYLPTDVDTSKNQKVSDADIIGGAIWIPFTAFLMHRCMIALKWASLSTTEYSKVMRVKTSEQAFRYQMQMQLLTSWQRRDADALCYYEVASAAARAGVDIRSKYIEIKNPELNKTARAQYDNWRLFFERTRITKDEDRHLLKEFLEQQSDGSYRASLLDVSVSILKLANQRNEKRVEEFSNSFRAITFIIILIPLLYLISQRISSSWTIVFYISSSFINYLFLPVNLRFLLTKRLDALRRMEEADILRELIRSSDFELSSVRSGENVSGNLNSLKLSHRNVVTALMKTQKHSARRRRSSVKTGEKAASAVHSVSGNKTSQDQEDAIVYMDNPTAKRRDSTSPSSSSSSSALTKVSKDVAKHFSEVNKGVQHEEVLESLLDAQSRHVVPMISLRDSQGNIMAWSYIRVIFRHLGERFLERMDAYIISSMVLMTMLMVVVLVLVTLSLIVASDSSSHINFSSPFVLQSVVLLFAVLSIIVLISITGAGLNWQFNLHRQSLQSHIMNVEDASAALIAQRASYESHELLMLRGVLNSLKVSRDAIKLYDEIKPYKILGLEASYALTTALVSGIGSSFVALITLFSRLLTSS